MRNVVLGLGALSFTILALPAQSKIVSPTSAATTEGSTGDYSPFGGDITRRYMQIHSDIAFGSRDPNLAVPGLCSNLRTNLAILWPVGSTNASGTIPQGGASAFAVNNLFGGGKLYVQAHVLDAGRSSAIPVTNSQGIELTTPSGNFTKIVRATRLQSNAGNVTVPDAVFASTQSVGYVLVTQFTY